MYTCTHPTVGERGSLALPSWGTPLPMSLPPCRLCTVVCLEVEIAWFPWGVGCGVLMCPLWTVYTTFANMAVPFFCTSSSSFLLPLSSLPPPLPYHPLPSSCQFPCLPAKPQVTSAQTQVNILQCIYILHDCVCVRDEWSYQPIKQLEWECSSYTLTASLEHCCAPQWQFTDRSLPHNEPGFPSIVETIYRLERGFSPLNRHINTLTKSLAITRHQLYDLL